MIVEAVLLYNSQLSGNCSRSVLFPARPPRARLRAPRGLGHRPLGPARAAGRLNPALRVPTLVLDDGRPLAESDAILCYFADGTPYLPDDPMSARRCCSGCSSSSTATSPHRRRPLLGRARGRAGAERRARPAPAAATPPSARMEGQLADRAVPGRRALHDRRHRPLRLHPRRARRRLRPRALPGGARAGWERVATQPGHARPWPMSVTRSWLRQSVPAPRAGPWRGRRSAPGSRGR